MAGSSSSGKPDPAAIAEESAAMVKAVEEAVQTSLTNFVTTADTEIQKLVKANTLPPDTAAEMLALHQEMIKKTTEIIKSVPLTWPPSKDSGGSS